MEVSETYLDALKERIKIPSERDLAFKDLLKIKPIGLTAENHVKWCYIMGRYYSLEFKDSGNIKHLSWANNYYDQMARIAYDWQVRFKSPKYLFVRAHIKFLLSSYLPGEASIAYFKDKATELTKLGRSLYPNNSSINWLSTQL